MGKILATILVFMLGCASDGTKTETASAPEASETIETPVLASALTPAAVYAKLVPLAPADFKAQPPPPRGPEFVIPLPSEKPYVNDKQPWSDDSVRVRYRNPESINQITIVTRECKTTLQTVDQLTLQKQLQASVKKVAKAVFNNSFALSDRYFVAMGPELVKPVRLAIKESFEPVMDMRIDRGIEKCDTRDGFGFRYDFFIDNTKPFTNE